MRRHNIKTNHWYNIHNIDILSQCNVLLGNPPSWYPPCPQQMLPHQILLLRSCQSNGTRSLTCHWGCKILTECPWDVLEKWWHCSYLSEHTTAWWHDLMPAITGKAVLGPESDLFQRFLFGEMQNSQSRRQSGIKIMKSVQCSKHIHKGKRHKSKKGPESRNQVQKKHARNTKIGKEI